MVEAGTVHRATAMSRGSQEVPGYGSPNCLAPMLQRPAWQCLPGQGIVAAKVADAWAADNYHHTIAG